jgi:hypothetical protein
METPSDGDRRNVFRQTRFLVHGGGISTLRLRGGSEGFHFEQTYKIVCMYIPFVVDGPASTVCSKLRQANSQIKFHVAHDDIFKDFTT